MNNNYTKDEILNAKAYMIEYKFMVETHRCNAGIIGRFFERIFGTSEYADIEVELQIKYNLTYYKAMEVLYYTNNQKYIYKL